MTKKLFITLSAAAAMAFSTAALAAFPPSITMSLLQSTQTGDSNRFAVESCSPISGSLAIIGQGATGTTVVGVFSFSDLNRLMAGKQSAIITCRTTVTAPSANATAPKTVDLGPTKFTITPYEHDGDATHAYAQTTDISGVRPLVASDGLVYSSGTSQKPLTGAVTLPQNSQAPYIQFTDSSTPH